jgi:hypothetical protein
MNGRRNKQNEEEKETKNGKKKDSLLIEPTDKATTINSSLKQRGSYEGEGHMYRLGCDNHATKFTV